MSLITDLLSNKENWFCNQIRAYRSRELKRIADEHEYRNRLSVGDFAQGGIHCCPKKLIQNKQKARRFAVKTGYKLDLGKEIHKSYQTAALNTPNLLWVKPYNFPGDIMVTSPDHPPISFAEKLKEGFPEIPVCMLTTQGEIAILGYADAVTNYYKKPEVTDIKTENGDPIIFKTKFEEDHPNSKHILQIKIYIYLMNLWDYYEPFKIKSGRIPYINSRLEAGDDAAEQECTFPYTAEDESIIGKMLAEGVLQVEAFNNGVELECGYLHCKACNKEEEQCQPL